MLISKTEDCLKCGGCVPLCPTEALFLRRPGIECDHDLCVECGDCTLFCPVEALEIAND